MLASSDAEREPYWPRNMLQSVHEHGASVGKMSARRVETDIDNVVTPKCIQNMIFLMMILRMRAA